MTFPKDFIGKKILIYGFGKTGKSVHYFLNRNKINHFIWDDDLISKKKNFDKNYFKKKFDFIILSPGVDIYHHKRKNFFLSHKNKIITDLDIFFNLGKNFKYVIGVTGTNGKSSFCNLLHQILKKNKIKSQILGNFGLPVLNSKVMKNKYYIVELSSYQIDYSKSLKLDSACILNISPDHLERHSTFSDYKRIKFKIFNFLKEKKVGFYSKKISNKYSIKNCKSFKKIDNNFINKLLNLKLKINLNNFKIKNLEHRNELFLKKYNFNFINDSKSTNFDASLYAIQKFNNIFLVLGGFLKSGDRYKINKILQRKIIKIFIIGQKIKKLTVELKKQKIKFIYLENITKVINYFLLNDFKIYKKKKQDYNFLFSPGAASFDQFSNFEDRGKKFKNIVLNAFKR